MLVLFNKPYNVLSQFTDDQASDARRQTLADYINIKNVYAADKDSEGLLLLTDDGALQNKITHPKKKLEKFYWVQVEGEVSDEAIKSLQQGILLKEGKTKPAKVSRLLEPENLWQRDPPVRFRKTIPTEWLEIVIREGKNRQVRRMTAAVGNPTLRLIRHRIGPWKLGALQPGDSRILEENI